MSEELLALLREGVRAGKLTVLLPHTRTFALQLERLGYVKAPRPRWAVDGGGEEFDVTEAGRAFVAGVDFALLRRKFNR